VTLQILTNAGLYRDFKAEEVDSTAVMLRNAYFTENSFNVPVQLYLLNTGKLSSVAELQEILRELEINYRKWGEEKGPEEWEFRLEKLFNELVKEDVTLYRNPGGGPPIKYTQITLTDLSFRVTSTDEVFKVYEIKHRFNLKGRQADLLNELIGGKAKYYEYGDPVTVLLSELHEELGLNFTPCLEYLQLDNHRIEAPDNNYLKGLSIVREKFYWRFLIPIEKPLLDEITKLVKARCFFDEEKQTLTVYTISNNAPQFVSHNRRPILKQNRTF
jgi:hypothetical protein